METGILAMPLPRGETSLDVGFQTPPLKSLEVKCFFEDSHLRIG